MDFLLIVEAISIVFWFYDPLLYLLSEIRLIYYILIFKGIIKRNEQHWVKTEHTSTINIHEESPNSDLHQRKN